jgi:hypothetical protein
MAVLSGNNPISKAIIDALGLKNVVNLDIRMHLNEVVQISVDYFPDQDDLKNIVPILQHQDYELIPKAKTGNEAIQ